VVGEVLLLVILILQVLVALAVVVVGVAMKPKQQAHQVREMMAEMELDQVLVAVVAVLMEQVKQPHPQDKVDQAVVEQHHL
jgi:hypothetical protein